MATIYNIKIKTVSPFIGYSNKYVSTLLKEFLQQYKDIETGLGFESTEIEVSGGPNSLTERIEELTKLKAEITEEIDLLKANQLIFSKSSIDKNIPDNILSAIDIIVKNTPDVVFGGSIALNVIGLIDRPVNDIDLFFPINTSLSKNNFLTYVSDIGSDTVTDVNGNTIQRTSARINDVKVCCFKVSNEELQCSTALLTNGCRINIQNVNYAILAKRSYAKSNPKHQDDLKNIIHNIEKLFK